MTIEECRRFYADEIRFAGNVQSPWLIEAFARVPREKFLGPGPWEIASPDLRAMSTGGSIKVSYTSIDDPRHLYHNVLVVLDKSVHINNGQPSALAHWIEAVDLKPGKRVYHLGCGAGYYTAVLAEIVGPEGSVVGSEVNPDLAARAQENLSAYSNVRVFAGDGTTVDPGPCDGMLINAGVTHPVPQWLDRLREGGRLIVPLTMATTPTVGMGMMIRITHQGSEFAAESIGHVGICSCTSARDPQLEAPLQAAIKAGKLGKMKSIRRDAHPPSDTCLVHGSEVCLSAAEVQPTVV